MPVSRRRRGYRLGLRRRRFGGPLRRRRYNGYTGRRRTRTVYRVRFMRPEVKKLDTTVEDATIDSGGVVQNIFDPAAGVAQGQYIGEKLNIRYLDWRCVLGVTGVEDTADPTNFSPILRVLLFVDKRGDSGGTAPGVTEVLETAQIQSSLNIQNVGRFEIISDRTFPMIPHAMAEQQQNQFSIPPTRRFYHVFRRLNIIAQHVTGAVPIHNRLYCLYISDTDEVGTITANARVGYTDA